MTTTSDTVLERLHRLHPKLIDLGLQRVEELLARLGNPQRSLAPVVHVAGTNGKGSTIAMLRAALIAAGRRVQVYTSPHLVRFHERIRLAEGLIGEDDLIALLEHCETVNENRPITYFEVTTVAAFQAFAREAADLLILETGLGGRLDATNVLEQPRLTLITPIDLDHAQFLGERLTQVAYEKAGILKPTVPAVLAPQHPEALAVIEARAEAIGAPLIRHGIDWDYQVTGDGLQVTWGERRWDLPKPVLAGPHQVVNAATAIVAAAALGDLAPDQASMARGLRQAVWPGRLERLQEGPLAGQTAEAAPAGSWELWLDGGHNPSAGRALAAALADWRDAPLYLICGMMNSKAAGGFLAPLAKVVTSCRTVAIPDEHNSIEAAALASIARESGLRAEPCDSLPAALEQLLVSERPGRILACGSIYFMGRLLDHSRWLRETSAAQR